MDKEGQREGRRGGDGAGNPSSERSLPSFSPKKIFVG